MLTGYQANDVTLAVAEGDLVFAAGVLYFTQQQGGLLLGRSRVQVDQTTPDARELLMADDSPQAPDGGLLDRDWPRFRVHGLRTSGHQPDARQLRPATCDSAWIRYTIAREPVACSCSRAARGAVSLNVESRLHR